NERRATVFLWNFVASASPVGSVTPQASHHWQALARRTGASDGRTSSTGKDASVDGGTPAVVAFSCRAKCIGSINHVHQPSFNRLRTAGASGELPIDPRDRDWRHGNGL